MYSGAEFGFVGQTIYKRAATVISSQTSESLTRMRGDQTHAIGFHRGELEKQNR